MPLMRAGDEEQADMAFPCGDDADRLKAGKRGPHRRCPVGQRCRHAVVFDEAFECSDALVRKAGCRILEEDVPCQSQGGLEFRRAGFPDFHAFPLPVLSFQGESAGILQ